MATASTIVNIAVFAPVPSANVAIVMSANPGPFLISRSA
jgi:hypothetical protein